jgi:hypothetical protein
MMAAAVCLPAQEQIETPPKEIVPIQPAHEARVIYGPVEQSISATSALITWSTNVSTRTVLLYGVNPNNLDQVAQEPWDGLTHRVLLNNLAPNTTYYYRVGAYTPRSGGEEPMRGTASFRTEQTVTDYVLRPLCPFQWATDHARGASRATSQRFPNLSPTVVSIYLRTDGEPGTGFARRDG